MKNVNTCFLGILLCGLCTSVFAENLTAANGVTYTNVAVKRVDPNGVFFTHSNGELKLLFRELPPEWQRRYGHDPVRAAEIRRHETIRRYRMGR